MKKGFTLVELIGVVVILGLIAAFSVPALTKTFKNTADKEYEEFVKNITLSAENYFHSTTDGKIDTKVFITVKELSDEGYLKKTVNPLTNTDVSDSATVIITKNSDGTEKYQFVDYDLTTNGYVRDGLILHYDGYSDIQDNNIIDLSGNENNGTINGITKEGNYYYLSSVNDFVTRDIALSSNNLTIEICFEYLDGGYIFRTDAGTTSQIYENNLLNGSSSSLSSNSGMETRTLQYYLEGDNKYFKSYLNGVASTPNTVTDLNNGTYIMLGSNNGDSATVKVYSVRIYSRNLTAAEVKQNYNVDKYRFGLGE